MDSELLKNGGYLLRISMRTNQCLALTVSKAALQQLATRTECTIPSPGVALGQRLSSSAVAPQASRRPVNPQCIPNYSGNRPYTSSSCLIVPITTKNCADNYEETTDLKITIQQPLERAGKLCTTVSHVDGANPR